MSKKIRIVPEHEEEYRVCDWCGEELKDYTTATLTFPDGSEKHFHKMYAGGARGEVEKTCLDFYEEKVKDGLCCVICGGILLLTETKHLGKCLDCLAKVKEA